MHAPVPTLRRLILAAAVSSVLPAVPGHLSGQEGIPKNLSEKQLFKMAEQFHRQGELERARDALLGAFRQRNLKSGGKNTHHKKYSPMLAEINRTLADRCASQAEEFCRSRELEACEQLLLRGREYAETPALEHAQEVFDNELSRLHAELQSQVELARSGEYERALEQIGALKRYSRYLPGLEETQRIVKQSYVDNCLKRGFESIQAHQWDEGRRWLNRALSLDPGNREGESGLIRIEAGQRAEELLRTATADLNAGRYEAAKSLTRHARELVPEDPQVLALDKRIDEQWVRSLETQVESGILVQGSFQAARETFQALRKLEALRQDSPAVRTHKAEAERNFGLLSLQKALQLEPPGDLSRVATSLILKMNGRDLLGPDYVLTESLKASASGLLRKVSAQIVIGVDNLAGAGQDFALLAELRLQNAVENLGIPELRIRRREEYQRFPDEDPQFQDLRPDGKSSTALLTLAIERFGAELTKSDEPERVKSQYVSGSVAVPNPEYEALRGELAKMERALDQSGNREAVTPEGYSNRTYLRLRNEFDKMPPTLNKPIILDYEYYKILHRQDCEIELRVVLRDASSLARLAEDSVRHQDSRQSFEVIGLHPQDVAKPAFPPFLLPPLEQMRREAERVVLEDLQRKLTAVLPAFVRRFFLAGQADLAAGDRAGAVESFLCHWAMFRGNIPQEELAQIREQLWLECGFDLDRQGPDLLSLVNRVRSTLQ
jgi:hypothetical protein